MLKTHLPERVSDLASRARPFFGESTRLSMPPLRDHDVDKGFDCPQGDVGAARGPGELDCLVDEVAGRGTKNGIARPQPQHDKSSQRLGNETHIRSW